MRGPEQQTWEEREQAISFLVYLAWAAAAGRYTPAVVLGVTLALTTLGVTQDELERVSHQVAAATAIDPENGARYLFPKVRS